MSAAGSRCAQSSRTRSTPSAILGAASSGWAHLQGGSEKAPRKYSEAPRRPGAPHRSRGSSSRCGHVICCARQSCSAERRALPSSGACAKSTAPTRERAKSSAGCVVKESETVPAHGRRSTRSTCHVSADVSADASRTPLPRPPLLEARLDAERAGELQLLEQDRHLRRERGAERGVERRRGGEAGEARECRHGDAQPGAEREVGGDLEGGVVLDLELEDERLRDTSSSSSPQSPASPSLPGGAGGARLDCAPGPERSAGLSAERRRARRATTPPT